MPRYPILTWSEVEEKERSTPGLLFNPDTPLGTIRTETAKRRPDKKSHFQDHAVCAIDLGPQIPGEHDLDMLEKSKGN